MYRDTLFTAAAKRNANLSFFSVLVAGISKLLHFCLQLRGLSVDVFYLIHDFLTFLMNFVILPWHKEKQNMPHFWHLREQKKKNHPAAILTRVYSGRDALWAPSSSDGESAAWTVCHISWPELSLAGPLHCSSPLVPSAGTRRELPDSGPVHTQLLEGGKKKSRCPNFHKYVCKMLPWI